jgi:hypothetical protein
MLAGVCARMFCRASHCVSREISPTQRLRQALASPLQARAHRQGLKRQAAPELEHGAVVALQLRLRVANARLEVLGGQGFACLFARLGCFRSAQ